MRATVGDAPDARNDARGRSRNGQVAGRRCLVTTRKTGTFNPKAERSNDEPARSAYC
jgi:hypothetical protein